MTVLPIVISILWAPAVASSAWTRPEVIVALAAVLVTTVTTLIAAWRTRRARRRALAEQVTIWTQRLADGRQEVVLRNGSSQQITDVVLVLSRPTDEEGSGDQRAHVATEAGKGEVQSQVTSAIAIPPERSVSFPVDIARLGPDIRPVVALQFRDGAGNPWQRDEGGRLRRSRKNLSAAMLGAGLIKGEAAATALSGREEEAEEIPGVAYSTHVQTAGSGNQLTVVLLPKYVQVDVEASAVVTINNELRATVHLSADERVIGVVFHNVKNSYALGKAFRVERWHGVDTLTLLFGEEGVSDAMLDRITQVLQVPLPRGGSIADISYEDDGTPVMMRVLDASRRVHPEFWRAASEAPERQNSKS